MHQNNSKILFLFILTVLSLNTLYSQEKLKGNKIVISDTRDISGFNSIEIRGKIDVILIRGNNQSVKVETDENLQFAIITEVNDEKLNISILKRIIKKKVLKIYITIDESISEITTKDKVNISADDNFNFNNLTINAQGDSKISLDVKTTQFILNNNESANVNLTINAEHVSINTNKNGKSKINLISNTTEVLGKGNSNTELYGNCEDLFITTENKSNVKAGTLECKSAIVNASDASDIHVNTKESITISAINSAEVYIYNNPEITLEKFVDKAVLRKK